MSEASEARTRAPPPGQKATGFNRNANRQGGPLDDILGGVTGGGGGAGGDTFYFILRLKTSDLFRFKSR